MMKRTVVLILMLLATTCLCAAREIVVHSTADSGAGTLRSALQAARSGDVITFDPAVFLPGSPVTIYPRSELPPIYCGNLTIDASDVGVIIDGSNIPGDWYNGVQVYSSYNTVMGLQIISFAGSGIVVAQGIHNVIGGDRSLGSGPIGQGNLVSGNSIGINLCDVGTSHNEIVGNLIGVHADERTPWGNHGSGVFIEPSATHNTVGPDNIVAYNGSDGVTILGLPASSNTITRNAIFGNGGEAPGGDVVDIALRDGGNASLPAPVIVEISGSAAVFGTASPNATVEFFSGDRHAEAFEGATVADDEGRFSFLWNNPLFGSYLLCTATDPLGNTSAFSAPMSTATTQLGEVGRRRVLEIRPSTVLADNRIGGMWNGFWQPFDMMSVVERQIVGLGLKRARLTINSLEQVTAGQLVMDVSKPEFDVDLQHDQVFTTVADNGVAITYTLVFWDKESRNVAEVLGGPRFESEDQILRYLDFTRFIVGHFQDRVQYFEIWNEPNIQVPGQHIAVEDYIELVRRVVPVIRVEFPEARIQVGGTSGLYHPDSREYLFSILESDVMPLVDAVSWHPLFGESPEHEAEYYYSYPSIVREIKEMASSHGFQGEYMADEVTWWVHGQEDDNPWIYTNAQAAKYYTRAVVQHLGMDVSVCLGGVSERPVIFPAIRNLCTIMADHEAIDIPVEIDIEYDGPGAYCAFRYPNGDRILAVWTDGVAQDEDPGVPATITFPGLTATTITGIDVLHGFEQELNVETDSGSTVIRGLLVKDYPILIRLSDVTTGADYEETTGDGYHQLGDVNAVPSSTGSGSDRDGDGVPDDEDYCPDWPGSAETSGC